MAMKNKKKKWKKRCRNRFGEAAYCYDYLELAAGV